MVSPAKAGVYALATHTSVVVDACRLAWMAERALNVAVMLTKVIVTPGQTAATASHARAGPLRRLRRLPAAPSATPETSCCGRASSAACQSFPATSEQAGHPAPGHPLVQ